MIPQPSARDAILDYGRFCRRLSALLLSNLCLAPPRPADFMMHLRMGKRIHLCEFEDDNLAEGLNLLFERKVEVPRIRHGARQTIDKLINEEAYLLAKLLRNERETWVPRIVSLARAV